MLLAAGLVFLERQLGGLYQRCTRLHKWLGIAGLVMSISHWLIAQGPKWMVALGWLEPPPRPAPTLCRKARSSFSCNSAVWPRASANGLSTRRPAHGAGADQALPYRRFVQTHRWLAVTYLALVLHSVVLVKFDYWATPSASRWPP